MNLSLKSKKSLVLALFVKVAQAANFTEISGVSQDVKGIRFPTFCTSKHKVPNLIHTVEPSSTDTISVWTDPPNLVTTTIQHELLQLWWNRTVSDSAQGGGVRIRFPPSKLATIEACCSASVQILPGFSNLEDLTASTSSNVRAVFEASDTTPRISVLDVSTSAKVFCGRCHY